MVAVEAADAVRRMVVLRRPGMATRFTKVLPAMPAKANREAISPESQTASFPYSCRK